MSYHFSRQPVLRSRPHQAWRRILHKLAALILLIALAAAAPAHSATVSGAIPGSFGVSESGAATYSIPIAVPPGTAGMEPKLSLNYSSQGGNGIAGVGWSLGGLSAFTRCPQTIIHDGATRGVQLDANDRFCLDGQRLILTTGTTYGAIGAEYRTEIESFSKVVSYGGTAGDPQYFKVWTKAGQIIELGNTADSRVEAQGKTVAGAWAVNKISDTAGNYLAFDYFEDNASGEHRIERIEYTGNTTANLSPYNAVEFQYEARPDPSSGYLAGSLSQQTQRLTRIVARANGTLAMDYVLSYEAGATTGRSRLSALTRCEANGDCLTPTTFGWQEGEAAGVEPVAVESVAPLGTTSNTWFAMGNMNSDGKTDVLLLSTAGVFSPYFAGTEGAFDLGETTTLSSSGQLPATQRMTLVDTDGDGNGEPILCGIGTYWPDAYAYRWDAKYWKNIDGKIDGTLRYRHISDESGIVFSASAGQWCLESDVNGDGRTDLVPYLSNYWGILAILPSEGEAGYSGSMTYAQQFNPRTTSYISFAASIDLSGDGRTDFVRFDPSNGLLRIWLAEGTNTGPTFSAPVSTTIDTGGSTSDRWFTTADVNGDGLGDIVLHTPTDGKLKVWLSKGKGTVTAKYETLGFSTGGKPSDTWFLMTDVNADGRADAIKYRPSTGGIVFALSNGNGTFGAPIAATIATGINPTPTVGPNPTTAWFQPADVNGDGLPDWVIYHPGEGKIKVNLGKGAVPDLLLTITDGHGATRSITYKPLTDPSVYTKGTGAVYPTQDVQNATYVVAETAADDGIGGQFRNAYRYEGARTHLTGRGFLGFAILEQTDLQTGIVTRTDYSQSFPNIGTPLLNTRTTSDGVELSRVENTPASKSLNAGKTYFPYVAYSKEQGRDLNGAVLPSTETWNTFDDWGNLTRTISQASDGFRKQTDNTYTNDATKWFLGRLTRASVASTANAVTQTRVSAFEYDATAGWLNKEIIEPDAANVQFRLDTTYTFDAFGNRNTTTVSSPATGTAAIATRSTTATYDARGQFPVTVANALGHTETKTFDPGLGVVNTLTGPNNLTTTWQYDGFGRKIRETRADGTFTQWTYDVCDPACPAFGVYRIVTQVFAPGGVQAAPVTVAYLDRLNRQVRAATQGFDGTWIYKDTQYDGQGRVTQVSRPYFTGAAVYWSRSQYDDLGRVIQIIEPDDLVKPALTVAYNGLTVTRTNRKAQSTTETRNSQGQKLSVTDAMGNVIAYAYDPFGNLTKTTNPSGNSIVNAYDIRGRKTQTSDPDLGLWKYEYTVLGELAKQTDAKLQVTTFKYDLLGRMTQRVEPGLTSDWIYDTAAYGKGKLQSAATSAGYIRSHYYDDKGRPQLTLSNLGAGNPLLFSSIAYDTSGRVSQQTYPSNFSVKHVYNTYGYLTEVRKGGNNALYWRADQMDAEGHITQETYGNGVVVSRSHNALNGRLGTTQNVTAGNESIQFHYYDYDPLGNIRGHWKNSGVGIYESMTYDKLNRLTRIDSSSNGETATETIAYDALGNITSKTGVGNYYYGGNANCINSNVGPHAVCRAGSNAYSYDANGNLTGGGGRTVAWTSWNMPSSVTHSGQTQSWLYGPEHDRYRLNAPGRTTWILNPGLHRGGHYERTEYAGGTTENRYTLYGGGRAIGEFITFDGSAPAQTRYFHSDGQGSISAVTDSTGAVLTRYKYDPWGKQTLISGSNTGIDQTRQGHTGHEMLDSGLTHMNGRLFDPVLARFVSADPIVQEPYNLQSLNRYSYVLNNPLYYTDPTGFSWWTKFRDKVLKPVVAIAAAWVIGPAAYNFGYWGAGGAALGAGASAGTAAFVGGVAGGALAGAAVGGVAGGIYNGPQGIVQGAKYGAIGGAITGPVAAFYGNTAWGAERLAAQSVSGGLSSAAQGGSFGDGFRNSFATGSAAWLYTSTVYANTAGRAANPMPGQGLPSADGTYTPNFSDGRVPDNLITTNLIGLNDRGNPAVFTGNVWTDFWANLGKQGGFPGTVINYIPGINATGVLHDTWWNPVNGQPSSMFGSGFNPVTNWGTMLPAAAITYGALLDNTYAGQSAVLDQIRK